MIALLRRPLPAAWLPPAAAALAVATALYCLGYTALAGEPEAPGAALAWAAINVVPWFVGFEAAKRCAGPAAPWLTLAATFGAATLLGAAADDGAGAAFVAVRHLPALGIVALLLWIGKRSVTAGHSAAARLELPLAPDQIDWVAAAGNYVEIRGLGRTLVRRIPLGVVERELRGRGFVRIHRSRLVRRDRIARVRPDDVILVDGTSLKVGKRYRAALID
jgi:hypothetical protein